MKRLVIGLAVAAAHFGASAYVTHVTPGGTAGLTWIPSGVAFGDGPGAGSFIGRNFNAPNAAARTLGVVEMNGTTLGGRALTVNAARTLGFGAIGTAAVALGASAWAGCAAGTSLYEAMTGGMPKGGSGDTRLHCGLLPDAPGAEWAMDPGQPPGAGTLYSTQGASLNPDDCSVSVGCGNSAAAAASAHALVKQNQERASGYTNCVYTITSMVGDTGVYSRSNCSAGSGGSWAFYPKPNVQMCPISIDFANPASSVPAGYYKVGPDGKCPTGRYTQPMTVEQAGGRLGTYGGVQAFDELARDVLEKGGTIEATAERSISGPATQTGSPTTKTTTSGTKTTTTTTTPTMTYTYVDNKVTYNITNNTTTTTVDSSTGATTTETTVETTPGEAADEEQTDHCIKNPERAGCTKLGELPSEEVSKQDKTIDWEAEDLGLGSACPPPQSWSVFGLTLTWSYEPVCDQAPPIKAALLIFASLGGIGIIIRGVGG